jgi:hypothetical protein
MDSGLALLLIVFLIGMIVGMVVMASFRQPPCY